MSNDQKRPPAQGEAEKKDTSLKEAVAEAIKEALPVATMAAVQVLKGPQKATPTVSSLERCQLCGQMRIACKDEHEELVVGPQNPRKWKDWPGIWLNGVQYMSADGNHRVTVPKENEFRYMIRQWEDAEDNLREGRVIEHNSGNIGGRGASGFRPANYPGFSK